MSEKGRPKSKKNVVESNIPLPESEKVQLKTETKEINEDNTFSPFPSSSQSIKSPVPPSGETVVSPPNQLSSSVIPSSSTSSESANISKTLEIFEKVKEDPLERLNVEFAALSPLEKEVIEIAKVVLKKKKYSSELKTERVEMMSPLVEQLYSKCIAKLTYTKGHSKESIFATIQSLKKNYWLVTDQRRTRYEILNSPILKNVLKFIQEHPGTHARDPAITEEIGITRNPFIKHVMVLEAFNLIRTKKIGRTLNYFIKSVPETFDDFVVLFSNPLVSNILILLMQEQIGLSEIARRLGVYHGAIQYHIKNLLTMNLITKEGKILRVNIELLQKYNELFKVPPFHMYF
jgi:predicted transcriptional regulator